MPLVGHGGTAVFVAHEVDDVAEFGRVAFIGGDEGFVAFEANGFLRGLVRAFLWQGGAGWGGHRFFDAGSAVIDDKNLIETQTAEQFAIPPGGVHDVERSARFFNAAGKAGEHPHEGAVHARTQREVNDDPLTS